MQISSEKKRLGLSALRHWLLGLNWCWWLLPLLLGMHLSRHAFFLIVSTKKSIPIASPGKASAEKLTQTFTFELFAEAGRVFRVSSRHPFPKRNETIISWWWHPYSCCRECDRRWCGAQGPSFVSIWGDVESDWSMTNGSITSHGAAAAAADDVCRAPGERCHQRR